MKKLTHLQYIDRLHTKHDNNIEILSDYVNSSNKIHARCNICQHEWYVNPRSLINGHGCPECGKLVAKNTVKWNITTDDFINKLNKYTSSVEVLSEYLSAIKPIQVKCKICDYKWSSSPYRLLKGEHCYTCGHKNKGLKHRKSHEWYVSKIDEYHSGTIEIIDTYQTGKHDITFRCNICDEIQSKMARRLLSRGCKYCCLSKGEKKIKRLLKSNGIKFEPQYSFADLNNGRLKFDFAIFDNSKLSHLIEYDGEQHFRPVSYFGGQPRYDIQVINDTLKNEYCRDNDIKLIRIPYMKYASLTVSDLFLY